MVSILKGSFPQVTLSERIGSVTPEGVENAWMGKAVWTGADDNKEATFVPPFVPDQWIIRQTLTSTGGAGTPGDDVTVAAIFIDEDDVEWTNLDGTIPVLTGTGEAHVTSIEDAAYPRLMLKPGALHANQTLTIRVKARANGRNKNEVTRDSAFSDHNVTPVAP